MPETPVDAKVQLQACLTLGVQQKKKREYLAEKKSWEENAAATVYCLGKFSADMHAVKAHRKYVRCFSVLLQTVFNAALSFFKSHLQLLEPRTWGNLSKSQE